jgi:hypothetical protein
VELLERAAYETRAFASPGGALDGFFAHGDALRSARRVLLVVDQRGREEIRWTWVSLLAHLDFGPVILLVDEVDTEIERRAERAGVLRCLEERHLARHPGLLLSAARRAFDSGRSLAPLGATG